VSTLKRDRHPETGELIDFVDGTLSDESRNVILEHLKTCDRCSTYVRSLEKTFEVLSHDQVPQVEPAFFAYLAAKARRSEEKPGWRRLLVPSLAGAAVVAFIILVLLMPAPQELDQIDLIMADMTTQELIESVGEDVGYETVLEDVGGDFISLEDYYQGETVYDFIETLSRAEQEQLVVEIKKIMGSDTSSSSNQTFWGC